MKYKPFNLEEAKAGKPVVTREGRDARYLCEVKHVSHRHVFAVDYIEGESVQVVSDKGSYGLSTYCSLYDLFMKPVKKEGWVNLYRYLDEYQVGSLHVWLDEESAKLRGSCSDKYIDTIRIEWEE